MQESLPQGETGWQEYVRKLLQGRMMGGLLEVQAWAVKSGYRVKVYRETKDGEGYTKIQEYGGERGVHVYRNPVEEDEGVGDGVGVRRGGQRKYSRRGGRSRLLRGGTG